MNFPPTPPSFNQNGYFMAQHPPNSDQNGAQHPENTSLTWSHTNPPKRAIWPQKREEKTHQILGTMREKKNLKFGRKVNKNGKIQRFREKWAKNFKTWEAKSLKP